MIYKREYGQELEALLAKIAKNKTLLREFLFDILTPTEYKDLSVRLQIVKQLAKGTPHREIAKNLHISIATVSRGSRTWMNKKGGFRQIINKYYKKTSK